MKQKGPKTSFLDVTEFILKELSPVFKPKPLAPSSEMPRLNSDLTPEHSPVLDARINFTLTPLFEKSKLELSKQCSIEELEGFSLDEHFRESKNKIKKFRRSRPRLPSSWYIVDDELDRIIEQNNSEDCQQFFIVDDDNFSDVDSSEAEQFSCQNSQIGQEQEAEEQKRSQAQQSAPAYEFRSPEWEVTNPKKQLVGKLRAIVSDQQIITEDEKLKQLKETFEKYLCEYEKYYFDDSMSEIQKVATTATEVVNALVKGIDHTFKRTIGGLPFEKRRVKLLRYLDKKKRRVWKKKVSYDCRKKVADSRLRIKGKFVTYDQACDQLGLVSVEGYTPEQIKQMLYKKLELE